MIVGHRETFSILKNNIHKEDSYIWFHAASLGEFEQGRPLIEKIRKEKPEYKIILSFFSPSGYEVRKNYPEVDVVCYLPFDTPRNAKKFVELAHPEMAVFIKYEFWANYLQSLHKKNIPIYLASGIFRKTQLFFRPYGKPFSKVLNNYTHFFVQDKESKALLESKQLRNITISGDTRFDRVFKIYEEQSPIPSIEKFLSGKTQNKPLVLVAGSTWEKDEELIFNYFNENPEIKLIIAPHEFNRIRLAEMQKKLKSTSVLYSQANENEIKEANCLIIDCFGLLSSLYRYGTIAYIGGGFGIGIHNTLEAAVYGIPVLFGPNYQRFKEAVELVDEKGAISVENAQQFETAIDLLLKKPSYRAEMGKHAGDYVKAHLGATNTIYEKIFWKKSSVSSISSSETD